MKTEILTHVEQSTVHHGESALIGIHTSLPDSWIHCIPIFYHHFCRGRELGSLPP